MPVISPRIWLPVPSCFVANYRGRVLDECVQLHGGAGYMDEYRISRLYTDARISRIYAGSSEVMREIIARSIGLDPRKRNQKPATDLKAAS